MSTSFLTRLSDGLPQPGAWGQRQNPRQAAFPAPNIGHDPTDGEIAYLATQRLGRLATVQPNGTLQNSPVGFHYNTDLETIDIGGRNMEASRKFRNVRDNGRVAFVVDDVASIQPWVVRCLEIRGHAEALDHPSDSSTDPGAAIIRVHPRRIISWGIDTDDRSRGKRNVPERTMGK